MEKIKRFLPIILIVVGVILIALPFYSNYKLKENMKNASIANISAETLKANENTNVIDENLYDFSNIEEISPSSTFLNTSYIDKSLLIGQLVIPSVNMNLSIFKGSTNENLLAGATTMKADDKMGEGNFTLAGHYSKDKSILFGSLMSVKIGDIIKVTDKTTIYEYKVYKTETVKDDSIYMIDNKQAKKRGNNIISLMTCYYSSKTGKRYFVLGDLVKSYPYEEKLMYTNDAQKS